MNPTDSAAAPGPAELARAAAAAALAERTGVERHDVAIVLGSGWVPAIDALGRPDAELAVTELPGFLPPAVEGHAGRIRSLTVGGRRVLAFLGRTHFYEGRGVDAGRARRAGGGRRRLPDGRADQRLRRPASGPGRRRPGADQRPPQPDLAHAAGRRRASSTSPTCTRRGCARWCARSTRRSAEGVYAMFPGPQYETPAEVRMAGILGADLVGMSTVLEAIAARAEGCEVLGLSLVTNLAAGLGDPLDHEEVLAAGQGSGRPGWARCWPRSSRSCEPCPAHRRRPGADRHGAARAAARPRLGRCAASTARRLPDGDRRRRRRPPADLDAGDGRRRRGRAPGRPADRGAVAGHPRRQHRRARASVFEAARRRRRAPRRLRLVQPRRRLHARSTRRAARRHPAAPGHALRRQQGLRRGARPLLRRPVRHAGRVPAHRHVRRPARPTCARCRPGCRPATAPGWSTPACAAPDLAYAIVWGVSANTRRTWSLDAGARARLRPARRRRDLRRRAAGRRSRTRPTRFVGGGFTSPGFGIDEVGGDRW